MAERIDIGTLDRAERSGGTSGNAIYEMVARALSKRGIRGDVAIDFGCGRGGLASVIAPYFAKYTGADAVRYEGFPAGASFVGIDLNRAQFPFESKSADAVLAIETIEHLENPRALVREMARIAKPGGWVLLTTPNQRSFLSLGTLLVKGRFSAFQQAQYPAHITALLDSDLRNIAGECGLRDVAVEYSLEGRIVLTPFHYPRALARVFPRLCSDNLLLIGRVG